MWAKNLLFIGLVLTGFAALAGGLFPEKISRPTETQTKLETSPASDRQPIVDELDRLFGEQWSAKKVAPAQRAPDLTIARRLALALTGSIPSLEEIRRIEAQPARQRVPFYLSHLLSDRRYSDYFAERLAR